ncbi:MAG: MerR family transcriptional regulator [Lysinibacillus sp.]|nr:MerR family transcriptional regulator [Lysinibacillus sp.]
MVKNQYLTISELSKLSNVPIRTLHYYDEINLFKPAYIDPKTNYRYYLEDQIYQLDLIKSLKYIGTPLKDIKYAQSLKGDELLEFFCKQEKIVEQKVKQILEIQQTLLKTKMQLVEQLNIPKYNEVYETTINSHRLLAIKTENLSLLSSPNKYFSTLIKTVEREGTIMSRYGGIYPLKNYDSFEEIYYDYLFTPLLTERYVELIQEDEEVLIIPKGRYACIAFTFDNGESYFENYQKLYKAINNPQSPVYEVYMPTNLASRESIQYVVELKVKIK